MRTKRQLGRTVHLTEDDAHREVQVRRPALTVEEIYGAAVRGHPLYLEPQRLGEALRKADEKQRAKLRKGVQSNE